MFFPAHDPVDKLILAALTVPSTHLPLDRPCLAGIIGAGVQLPESRWEREPRDGALLMRGIRMRSSAVGVTPACLVCWFKFYNFSSTEAATQKSPWPPNN